MKQEKQNILSSKGSVSSMRLAMLRCVNTSIFLAVGALTGYFAAIFLDKPIPGDVLGGTALLIAPFLAFSVGGKAAQSFSEHKESSSKHEEKEPKDDFEILLNP